MSSTGLVEITVLYFAAASTATGLTTEQIPLPVSPASHSSEHPLSSHAVTVTSDAGKPAAYPGFPLTNLATLLVVRYPNTTLASVLASSSWAVDAEMVDDPSQVFLHGGEEVAVICPVSGG